MNDKDVVNYVRECRENHICYQSIADTLHISKPAAQRIFETGKVGKEIAKTLNLEPSAKILRDRERRKEQKNEIMRLRAENVIIKAALMAHLQADCKCPFCSGARKALANL